jgi:hypothetical protein
MKTSSFTSKAVQNEIREMSASQFLPTKNRVKHSDKVQIAILAVSVIGLIAGVIAAMLLNGIHNY